MAKRKKRTRNTYDDEDEDYDYKQGFRTNGKVEEPCELVDDENLEAVEKKE